MNRFRDLNVYHKAIHLTKRVRETKVEFPNQEAFGLSSQFKRAVDSIALNIAEWAGNTSRKEFAKDTNEIIAMLYSLKKSLSR